MTSFRTRVLRLLLVLVVAIQLVTVGVLVYQTNRRAERQAGDDLQVGARVLDALLQSRAEQLREAVRVLVADYGFKEAATSGDAETLVSALDNSAERVDAQLAMLLDTTGRVTAATTPRLAKHAPQELARLAVDEGDAPSVSYLIIDDTLYMLVGTTVRAPTPVATAVLGFAVDARFADRLSKLLGYRISFAFSSPDKVSLIAVDPAVYHDELLQQLRDNATDWSRPLVIHERHEAYMTWMVNLSGMQLGDRSKVRIVLQKPVDAALAPYMGMRTLIFIVALLAMIAATPIALRLAKQISRPLEKLASAARRIESGNYKEPVAIDGPREFVAVANTLDSMQRNIAEREQKIRHQATHDEFTGLPNRLFATQALAGLLARADRPSTIAVLVLEILDFDRVHAGFGFNAADVVATELARRMKSLLGEHDVLARVSSAQFLLVAPNMSLNAMELKARELLQSVRNGYVNEHLHVSLRARIGMSMYPEHGSTADELQRRADTALFDAKSRDASVGVYDPTSDELQRRQLALLGDLRRAIESDELTLHYQPKVDMRSHTVRSLEALVRWEHPVHGRISPDDFIPLAERTGNMALLTQWVLKTALRHMREWLEHGFEPDVSINISASDLSDNQFAERAISEVTAAGIAANRLMLEVTESAVMNETKQSIATMERLRAYGMRFSVDDFGTGYSSLAQFKQLPVDEIKIDKSFVLKMTADSDDAVIVRSTIELGHNLSVHVVAEGVETPDSWRMLSAWGCDYAQGYLVSRPVEFAQVPAIVRKINERLGDAETATQQLYAFKIIRSN